MSETKTESRSTLSPYHAKLEAYMTQCIDTLTPRVQSIRHQWREVRPDHPSLEARLNAIFAKQEQAFSEARIKAGQSLLNGFPYRPSDVFISTSARSGTTLTQQIVHQLRTGGDEAFTSICDVVPWLDLMMILEQPLPGAGIEEFSPRAFKTHLPFDMLPPPRQLSTGVWQPPTKFIQVVRNPCDMLLSVYEFVGGWQFEREQLSLDEFIRDSLYCMPVPPWMGSLISYKVASDAFPDHILWVFFEDLVTHRMEAIHRIGVFMGLQELPDFDARVRIATERTSIEYMKTNSAWFEDPQMNRAISEAMSVERRQSPIVAHGVSGRGKQTILPETQAELNAVLGAWLETCFGVPDYAAFRDCIYKADRYQVFRPQGDAV